MQIRVLFLGPSRDISGVESASLDVQDSATTASIRSVISAKFPRLAAGLPSMRIAVNLAFVPDEYVLRAGDELALIPPVSGG